MDAWSRHPGPPATRPRKKLRPGLSCANCGVHGHFIKDCAGPVTSFGIIAFRRNYRGPKTNKSRSPVYLCDKHRRSPPADYRGQTPYQSQDGIEFLMVQRKDTMAFTDFMRGKYRREDTALLSTFIGELTCSERKRILESTFDEIWSNLWVNHNSRCYIREYSAAKDKYDGLRDKKALFDSIECNWCEPEFGFPKGRKNMRESSLKAAICETCEETGYSERHLNVLSPTHFPILNETFIGTNGIKYQHIYYIAEIDSALETPEMDADNIHQASEIQDVCWMSFGECMRLIRPYDTAKQDVLVRARDLIKAYVRAT
ncbi:hypothetical protein GGF32_003826 [Allomyces javanicus]|nr:hypothetical protein GGF32_003826 [Allomyces javanicus]